MALLRPTPPSTQSNSSASSSALPDGIRRYIVRPGGKMVPLVPVDQLPFQLEGIPVELNHAQLFQEHWEFCGEAGAPVNRLQVSAPTQLQVPFKFLPPDHEVKSEGNPTTAAIARNRFSPFTSSTTQKPIREPQLPSHRSTNSDSTIRAGTSLADSFASIYIKDAERLGYNTRRLPPSGIEPDQSKKEYCTYWIKTGECAFTVQGCRYKHEMPSPAKLKEIGFNTVPLWWKERSALKRPTWMERRMNADSVDESEDELILRAGNALPEFVFKHRTVPGVLKSEDAKQEPGFGCLENEREQQSERKLIESPTKHRRTTSKMDNGAIELIDLSDNMPSAPPCSPQSSVIVDSDTDGESVISSPDSVSTVSSASVPRLESECETLTPTPAIVMSKTSRSNPVTRRRNSEVSYISQDTESLKVQGPPTSKRQPRIPSCTKAMPTPSSSAKKPDSSYGLTKSKHATPDYDADTQAPLPPPQHKVKLAQQSKETEAKEPKLVSQIEGLRRGLQPRKKQGVEKQKVVRCDSGKRSQKLVE